jgi:hypothetical protein
MVAIIQADGHFLLPENFYRYRSLSMLKTTIEVLYLYYFQTSRELLNMGVDYQTRSALIKKVFSRNNKTFNIESTTDNELKKYIVVKQERDIGKRRFYRS